MATGWFDSTAAEEFGVSLARFCLDRLPVTSEKLTQDRQLRNVVKKLVGRMDQFKADHALNAYQKAKLWNAFKWTLIEAGHERAFADDLTRELVSLF